MASSNQNLSPYIRRKAAIKASEEIHKELTSSTRKSKPPGTGNGDTNGKRRGRKPLSNTNPMGKAAQVAGNRSTKRSAGSKKKAKKTEPSAPALVGPLLHPTRSIEDDIREVLIEPPFKRSKLSTAAVVASAALAVERVRERELMAARELASMHEHV